MKDIESIVLPVITPFDSDGQLDEKMLREAIEFEISAQVNALFFLGSYGQGPVMNPEERVRAAEIAVEQTRKRVPVLIQVGAADTYLSIDLARHAQKTGADALVIVSPFYYKHNEYEIIEHFRTIAASVDLPVLIYNNPPFTNINVTPNLAEKIVQAAANVFGIKNAKGTLQDNLNYQRTISPDFRVFCSAALLIPGIFYGLSGSISPPMASFPELGVALVRAAKAKDYAKALELHKKIVDLGLVIKKLEKKVGRGIQWECIRLRGLKVQRYPRWETASLNDEERQELREAYKAAGVNVV